MAFQDLLKKQINLLGKELNELLERVLPLNDPDLMSLFVEDTNKILVSQFHSSLEELVKEQPEQLHQLLIGKDSERMENLEKLADLFAALAQKENYPDAALYREESLAIYQYITEQTATFSFVRGAKITALKN